MATGFEAKAAWAISALVRDLGITPQQAAGIVGQLGHESAGLQAINEVNPTVPGSRGGFGWAQWTGPRRRQFEQWAQNRKLPVTSDEANYGFLLDELTAGPESAVVASIRSAPDAETAGRIFTDKFLRPGIPGYGSRSKWTQRAEGAIGGPVEAAGGGAGSDAPYQAPSAPAASPAAPVATAAAKTPWWQQMAKSIGSAGAKGMPAFQAPAVGIRPMQEAARIDQGDFPTIDPQAAELQRQQLAMAMQRLNSGSLWG